MGNSEILQNFTRLQDFRILDKFIGNKCIYGELHNGTTRNRITDLASTQTPIRVKAPDDASSICETWYNWIILEFLKIILTNICDGTTFHHLWDYKILFKRDDWILQVSEVWFGNRSRIGHKLYTYTQSNFLVLILNIDGAGGRDALWKASSPLVRTWVRIQALSLIFCIYAECQKWCVLKIDSTFKTHVQSLCKNTRCACNVPLTISPSRCRSMVRPGTRDYCVSRTMKYSPSHWCDIPLSISYRMLCI